MLPHTLLGAAANSHNNLRMTPEQTLKKWLEREKRARTQAEALLEEKSRHLYQANQALAESAENLEKLVAERTRELEQALEQLHTASRAKDDFLATISHEIRTPLNALLGAVGLLKTSSLDRTQRHYLELGEHAGQVLLDQINHILDYVRLQDSNEEPELEHQPVTNLMEQVIYAVAGKAHAKGLRLFGSMDYASDTEVIVDSAKARQVVLNFLDNAIKFTPAGWVWFRVSASDVNNEYVEILCEVIDTGFGLPADADRLFLPFERNERQRKGSKEIEGTGLGLSISKKIVDGYEGGIGAEPSPYGQGSRFWCSTQVLVNRAYQPTLPRPGTWPGVHLVMLSENGAVPWLEQTLVAWEISHEVVSDLAQVDLDGASRRFDNLFVMEFGGSVLSKSELGAAKHVVFCQDETQARALPTHSLVCFAKTSTEFLKAVGAEFQTADDLEDGCDGEQRQGRLLLVEDSHANQIITSAMLTRQGYLVDTASNGQEAVDAAARLPYDLILMDIQMPVMDGLEATSLIQQAEVPHPKPTIVALTASLSDQIRRQCDELGVKEIIPKPVVPEVLFRAVERWCDYDEGDEQEQVAGPEEEMVRAATIDELAASTSPELLKQLFRVFSEEIDQRLQASHNAMSDGDLTEVGKQAHAVKSVAGTYGATQVQHLGEALELAARAQDREGTEQSLAAVQQAWGQSIELLKAAYEAAARPQE